MKYISIDKCVAKNSCGKSQMCWTGEDGSATCFCQPGFFGEDCSSKGKLMKMYTCTIMLFWRYNMARNDINDICTFTHKFSLLSEWQHCIQTCTQIYAVISVICKHACFGMLHFTRTTLHSRVLQQNRRRGNYYFSLIHPAPVSARWEENELNFFFR